MSTPISPPNGIVSVNIKLFNNNDTATTTATPVPAVTSPPSRYNRSDIPPTAIKQSHSTLVTSPRNVENIRRHATGDNSTTYLQLQHQKVFPHATGNGQLQRTTHISSNDSFNNASSRQQQNGLHVPSPPPPPPRPSAGALSLLESNRTGTSSSGSITKKEDDTKLYALTYVNTNVFKGVFGKVVGSVSGK